MAWILLTIAIVAEVVATSALKMSDGFTRFWPSMLVIAGYGIAFYLLSLVVRQLPVGIVYALWAGLGVVLVAVVGWVVYGQKIDAAGLFGIALILAGVLVLNLLSGSVQH